VLIIRNSPAVRTLLLIAFHAIVFGGCLLLAWLLRFDFDVPAHWVERARTTAPLVLATQLIAGSFFGFYRGWWRYVGIGDVFRVVFGVSAAQFILIAAWYLGPVMGVDVDYVLIPRGVLIIDGAFVILTLFGTRVLARIGLQSSETPEDVRRVLIIGAGDAGETLAREIEHRPQLAMKVVAFIDDQRAKWGSMIRGVPVRGPVSSVARIADEVGASEALIAIPSAEGLRIRAIIRHLSAADLAFRTIPGLDQLVSGRVVTQLRPVNLDDLLRRQQIALPGDPMRDLFAGKRVVVTGAGGTIGSELVSQISELGPATLAMIESAELPLYEIQRRMNGSPWGAPARITGHLVDAGNRARISALFNSLKPHVVLHAAAHKHVPLGEENALEYLRNNTLAARSIAEVSAASGVERFVLISTDKAINPTSVMGMTKRAAEIAVLDVTRNSPMKAAVVRFGNVIGSSGSVIPLFVEQIRQGGPLTITHPDVTRYFIRTSEAISLVLQAATLANAGEIFTLDMGEPVRIVDLARDLIRLSGHTEDEFPLVFTGLRPGEKLFEEIRLEGEAVHRTVHPQIVVTETPQPAGIEEWLERARHAASDEEAREVLKLIVDR
jgi:FlaA1/EpsC-like NDP-sugar epimerase